MHDAVEGTMPLKASHRQNDIPFHSGPLRLSIFRESSPPSPPKAIDVSGKYDAIFESFLKRRPLSESFTRNFSAYDFSSSSDEEVSEPLPESPLNLSDTENMSTGHNSPGIFGRRRNKFFSSSQSNTTENRPKSLYDSAKPRPPGTDNHKAERGKVGDRLPRFMQFRIRRTPSDSKREDYSKSTYERSYEPVPPNVTWTNVVGQNSIPKLQPHPPTTSPTTLIPNPKKKRHAPKPPANVTPYCVTEGQNGSVYHPDPTESHGVSKPEHLLANSQKDEPLGAEEKTTDIESSLNDFENVGSKVKTLGNFRTSIGSDVERKVPEPECLENTHLENGTSAAKLKSSHEIEEISLHKASNEEVDPVRTFRSSVDTPPTPSTERSVTLTGNPTTQPADVKLNPRNKHGIDCDDPLRAMEKQRQVIKELIIESKIFQETNSAPIGPLHHTSNETPTASSSQKKQSKISPSHVDQLSNNATSKPPVSLLHGTDLVIRLIVDDLLTSVEEKLLTEVRKSNHFNSLPRVTTQTKTVTGISNDVKNDVVKFQCPNKDNERVQVKSSKRAKSHEHKECTDNASSGYSSPGSGDEAPISPQTPISAQTIPSPTSSYYSTSLSASSSRVSNLSRELMLAKAPSADESVHGEKSNSMRKIYERPLVTPVNKYSTTVPILTPNADVTMQKSQIGDDDNLEKTHEMPSVCEVEENTQEIDGLSEFPVKTRGRSIPRPRAKSEYIPYRSDREELKDFTNRVSISMIEKPTDTSSLSRAQAKLYHQKGSKKKALAAAQKSRAFAMRAKPRWHRHSYAESSEDYILAETENEQKVPSSNLVSHFVSTQDISTYFDGSEYRTITAKEILNSKREEFFNAYKHPPIGRNSEIIGGSVRHLPVSTKEFGFINDIIQEDTEVDSGEQVQGNSLQNSISKTENVADSIIQETEINKENTVQRNPSEASSSSSGTRYSNSLNDSTWSLSGEMSSQGRQRKPSLRRRIQSAFSFQNIRKAISMEKLDEDEKRRSMSHHYLNENGTQYMGTRDRSATLQERSSNRNGSRDHEQLRKAPSISSLIQSVRMRKRRSRMRAEQQNRYTIADPESFAKSLEKVPETKRSSQRPISVSLANDGRRKLEDVGSPSFFRPIGRVLQMNPSEGTLLVEMVKPASGPFGFYIARKKECGDSGSVYISRLSDSYPDKMFAGLMRTGDEITEVNGTSVSGLTLDEVYDLILDSDKTLLKLKPSQVHMV